MKNITIQSGIIAVVLVMCFHILKAQTIHIPSATNSKKASVTLAYEEMEVPFAFQDTSIKGHIMIHILDQDLKPYSGFEFRLETKDFTTKQWNLYNSYQICVNYNEGQENVIIMITDLPNGYYRGWVKCARTGTIGWVPILLDRTKEDNPSEVVQYTLEIPQSQYWLSESKSQILAENERNKK